MRKNFLIILSALLLTACVTTDPMLKEGKASFAQHNYATAFNQLLPLAEQGNADAQYAVGYMYFYGRGVPEDRTKATEWMERAAIQHQPQAVEAMKLLKTKPPEAPQDPVETLN